MQSRFIHQKSIKIRLLATLIAANNQYILIDTGLPEQPALINQLTLLGVTPEQIDLVINTHLHIDHMGNNYRFKNARIIMSRIEFDFADAFAKKMIASEFPEKIFTQFFSNFSQRRLPYLSAEIRKSLQTYWTPERLGRPDQIEYIEDKPVLPHFLNLWPTPGHTKAHYAIECRGKQKSCLITGDAMPAKMFWKSPLKELVPRYDEEKFRNSKKEIESFTGIIIPSHDLPFESYSRQTLHGTIKLD